MFSWQFNDAELPANPNIVPNGNQLTVNSVTEDAGGVYRCTVSTINNGQLINNNKEKVHPTVSKYEHIKEAFL